MSGTWQHSPYEHSCDQHLIPQQHCCANLNLVFYKQYVHCHHSHVSIVYRDEVIYCTYSQHLLCISRVQPLISLWDKPISLNERDYSQNGDRDTWPHRWVPGHVWLDELCIQLLLPHSAFQVSQGRKTCFYVWHKDTWVWINWQVVLGHTEMVFVWTNFVEIVKVFYDCAKPRSLKRVGGNKHRLHIYD